MASDKVQQVWDRMNESERYGASFGLFPAWVGDELTDDEIVELMGMGE